MAIVLDGTSGLTTNSGTVISASTIGVGGATPSTSGSGITFPATQSASSNANTLDDYEEGTWTGALSTGYGSMANLNSFVQGTYTKIGTLVYVQGIFKASSPLSVDATIDRAFFSGLPFTVKSTSGDGGQMGCGTAMSLNSTGSNAGSLFSIGVDPSATTLNIWCVSEHGTTTLSYLSFGITYTT
jgi:hypothetical protein